MNSIYGERLKSIRKNQFPRYFSAALQPMLTIIDIHEDKLRYSDEDWWQYNKKYENERTWLISRNCQNLHFAIVQILDLPIVWACRWTCETTLSDAPITYGSLLEGAFSLCVRLKFFSRTTYHRENCHQNQSQVTVFHGFFVQRNVNWI